MTLPFRALEPLGSAALERVRWRLVPRPPPASERDVVVLLSRADMGRRRSLRNQPKLLGALRATLRAQHRLEVYEGSQHRSLVETAALFSRAALITGPHGGAFLNMVYCAPGTPVVEIGYLQRSPMAYPSYYHTMARRLGLSFWIVLAEGGYERPLTAPVGQCTRTVSAALYGVGDACP